MLRYKIFASKSLCFIVLTFPISSLAGFSPDTCPTQFKLALKSLVKNPNVVTREGEKAIAGTILQPHQKFPKHLKDGAYLYVTDSKGRTAYSTRVPDLTDVEHPLVTHRSLIAQLKATYPNESLLIFSAGEFEVSLGRIAQINNKASTFKGSLLQMHLQHAERTLSRKGLRIEPGTSRIDYATRFVQDAHTPELNEARLMIHYSKDPEFVAVVKDVKNFFRRTQREYPSGVPGKTDLDQFYASTTRKVRPENMVGVPQRKQSMVDGATALFLEGAQDEREFYFRVDLLVQSVGREKALESLKSLERFEGVLTR